jgi:hypothetical protein
MQANKLASTSQVYFEICSFDTYIYISKKNSMFMFVCACVCVYVCVCVCMYVQFSPVQPVGVWSGRRRPLALHGRRGPRSTELAAETGGS